MSTKIYYAFRFKKDKWVEFIDMIHDQMFDLVLKQVKYLMTVVKIDEEKYQREIKKYAAGCKKKERNIQKWTQFEKVIENVKKASKGPERDIFDLDCGVNFWMYGQYVYAIPICPYWIYDNLKMPNWVEDYSYWNNTDPPKNVPYKQWKRRGETWDNVNCGNGRASHNARRLYHSVINFESRGSYVNRTELQLKIFPRS